MALALDGYACLARSVTVTSAPAAEPVLKADAKTHLNIPSAVTDHDTWLEGLITAARIWVEEHCGLALITQTQVARYDGVPAHGAPLLLPRAPVASVTSLVSYDVDDAATTFSSSAYLVDTQSRPARIVLNDGQSWPSDLRTANAVLVTYQAGYGSGGSSVPKPILQAILLLVAHWFEQREPVITTGAQPLQLPLSVASLLAPYTVWPV